MTWFVYIARCSDGSLYTGVTTDPDRRESLHNAGRGAAYTRSRRPVRLVYRESARDRGAALRREAAIKRLARARKEQMVTDRTAGEFAGFGRGALSFLRSLARNNRREWFERHRAEYELEVLAPLRELVEEMDVRLATIAPELIGNPRRSIFRIHRDVRFSADKSPYKTNAACQFYHQDAGRGAGQDAEGAGAGLYFHLADGECFVAGGIWMPARSTLDKIREAIAADHKRFCGDPLGAGVPAPLQAARRGGHAQAHAPRIRREPPSRTVAPIPLVHGDSAAPGRRGVHLTAACDARPGFCCDGAVRPMAQWSHRLPPGYVEGVTRSRSSVRRTVAARLSGEKGFCRNGSGSAGMPRCSLSDSE